MSRNSILPKFARPLYFFFSSAFWHLKKQNDENSQWFCILVCNFLTSKHYRSGCRSRWENLDRGQYPFQPIKLMHLVVPSPCETEPYNKVEYKTVTDVMQWQTLQILQVGSKARGRLKCLSSYLLGGKICWLAQYFFRGMKTKFEPHPQKQDSGTFYKFCPNFLTSTLVNSG